MDTVAFVVHTSHFTSFCVLWQWIKHPTRQGTYMYLDVSKVLFGISTAGLIYDYTVT